MKSNKTILRELAKDLRTNHVRHSFSSEEITSKRRFKSIINDKNPKKTPRTRTIFIIGAGASTNVSSAVFPPGAKAINLIEGFFELDEWPKRILKKSKKVQELANLPNIDDANDFETRLFSLSHFLNSFDVQEAIGHIYDYRTFPNLFYEILAHLLKNRYIDGIINFNFDELLDQTVEEEVGMGQLHKIMSDGDCIDYKAMLVDDRLKIPFYIKPHGTASHKSSLLFTKEQYVNLSLDLEGLIEEILTGQPLTGSKIPSQFDKLNIVTAGFQMESIEFNKVMQRSLTKLKAFDISVDLIYLSYSDFPADYNGAKSRLKGLYGDGCNVKVGLLKRFNVSRNRSTGIKPYLEGRYLDHFGLSLIDEITKGFKDTYRPGDIYRHIGLISFFQDQILNVSKTYTFKGFNQ
ncbi:MAG: SIR2 family protein, partial [Bacteroidota bacterium]